MLLFLLANITSRLAILATFFIYIRAGREIYKKHTQLKNFSSHHEPEPLPVMNDPFSASKTTEITVTSESVAEQNGIDLTTLGGRRDPEAPLGPAKPNPAYSVNVFADRSSVNRAGQGELIKPVVSHASQTGQYTQSQQRSVTSNPVRRRQAYEANNAAWSYTKCAILFFSALLVTWIPSSANRVYSVVHTSRTSLPLEYMSALVLPLQGFWNAIIYIVTSWKACQMLADDVLAGAGRRPKIQELVGFPRNDNFQMMSPSRNPGSKNYESESMTELANSRPNSEEQHKRRR